MKCREKNRNTPVTLDTLDKPRGVIGKLVAAHKVEVTPPPTVATNPNPPDADDILAMSYEQFAKADLALAVRSALLGEDIVIASNEAAAARDRTKRVVYILDEFRHLYAGGELDVDALLALHRLKQGLPGARAGGMQGPVRDDEDGKKGCA